MNYFTPKEHKQTDKMKRSGRFSAICLVAATLLTACSQDELSSPSGEVEGAYPLQIGSVTMSVEGSEQPWTRVAENTDGNSSYWEGGETIGVQLATTVGTSTGQYTLSKNGTNITATPVTGQEIYWKSTTEQGTVTAWYPINTTISLADQRSELAYVLKGTCANTVNYNTAASLTFAHKLAKVRVELTGDNASAVTEVKLNGITSISHTQGELGSTDGAQTGYILMHQVPNTNNWEANVVPGQTIDKVWLNGTTECTITPTITTAAATVNRITITVNQAFTITDSEGKPVEGYTIHGNGTYTIKGKGDRTVTISDSPTVTLEGVDISTIDGAAINISDNSNPTLVISGENTVSSTLSSNTIYSYSGISIGTDASLTIQGAEGKESDKLIAKAGGTMLTDDIGAGIGSAPNTTCGNIIIKNVTIEATGGSFNTYNSGAGIGTGTSGTCGNIEITDANVTATGGYYGAGIGTGSNGNCGDITIKNSTINATGGTYAAAIGLGSANNNVNTKMGSITIEGSEITATGGTGAAVIGFSVLRRTQTLTAGKISITTNKTQSEFLAGLTRRDMTSGSFTQGHTIGKGAYDEQFTGGWSWQGVTIYSSDYPNGNSSEDGFD